MSNAVVHNIVAHFVIHNVIHNDIIIAKLQSFVIHNSLKRVTMSIVLSFIIVNCHLFVIHSYSNFMSKAEGTALPKMRCIKL